MSTIKVLNNISLYNSITAASGITTDTLVVTTSAAVRKLSINSQELSSFVFAVSGDAYINGNLNVSGSAIFHNTEYTTTSSISVTNTGTGPALIVNQTGEQAVAAFYDDNQIALYIDGLSTNPGYVGIGTSTPNEKLTVIGNISATGIIYGSNTLSKFVSAFGDGANLSYTLDHGLNTEDVVTSIIDTTTKEVVYPSVINYSSNSIVVEFSDPPALSAYKAIIIG